MYDDTKDIFLLQCKRLSLCVISILKKKKTNQVYNH